jgi:hypothetical protein
MTTEPRCRVGAQLVAADHDARRVGAVAVRQLSSLPPGGTVLLAPKRGETGAPNLESPHQCEGHEQTNS